MKKICVLGLGYIGLPTASMFATHGHQVIGVDVNDRVVDILNSGEVHIYEPGLKTLVQAGIHSGQLRATRQPEPADVFIIAVPTPLVHNDGATQGTRPLADLGYIESAATAIVPHLRPGNLVILESTIPPRTTLDVLVPILERSGIPVHTDNENESSIQVNGHGEVHSSDVPKDVIYAAHCPERVLPGRILQELVHNDRVIGGVSKAATQLAQEIYASFVEGEILLTDATTAEIVKLMENTYRDINIALANEFAQVAEQIGINVFEAIKLANHHPRVNILTPGPGVGGHCIAVDPWFIAQIAPTITPLIQTARQINDTMPQHVVGLVNEALGNEKPVAERVIACLGLAYKADVDDMRESPAVTVIKQLQSEGYQVRVFDPHIPAGSIADQVESVKTAVSQADLLLILTDHSQFRQFTPQSLLEFTGNFIIDTRNTIDVAEWTSAGKQVWQVGNTTQKPSKTPTG